jgi:hypothetical protein
METGTTNRLACPAGAGAEPNFCGEADETFECGLCAGETGADRPREEEEPRACPPLPPPPHGASVGREAKCVPALRGPAESGRSGEGGAEESEYVHAVCGRAAAAGGGRGADSTASEGGNEGTSDESTRGALCSATAAAEGERAARAGEGRGRDAAGEREKGEAAKARDGVCDGPPKGGGVAAVRSGLCGTDCGTEPPREGPTEGTALCGVDHDWREAEREGTRDECGEPPSETGR